MPESKFISFMIFQKLADYPEIRILLKKLININEVKHIGTNINRIIHNNL